MTEQELQAYTERCGAELEEKQKALKERYRLSGRDPYALDLDKMVLHIKKEDGEELSFSVVLIGSLAPVSRNWLWAWANESLSEKVRDRSASLKALYKETGFDIFRADTFKADTGLAQDLSALAIHHLDAEGLYRVNGGEDQDGQVMIYLALTSL
jgi:hypothetical protein